MAGKAWEQLQCFSIAIKTRRDKQKAGDNPGFSVSGSQDKGDYMEKEITMEELLKLLQSQDGEFIIHVEFGKGEGSSGCTERGKKA